MQRVGFRLSQAERGYGENYDLAGKYLLEDQKIFNHHSHHALHVVAELVFSGQVEPGPGQECYISAQAHWRAAEATQPPHYLHNISIISTH